MIKICKCDDFCEMNPLFPFHSQRTVDGEDRESGLPVNLNKHLITHRRTDFKVWWPQDPAIHVLWSTAGFPGRGWGHSGNIVSVFLGKQSGMCLKRQSWREPICTSPLLPGLVLPTLTCLKVTWVALRCFSLSPQLLISHWSGLSFKLPPAPWSCLVGGLKIMQCISFVS